MMVFVRRFGFILCFLFIGPFAFCQDAMEIVRSVFSMVSSIQYLTYTAESIERVNGKMKYENSSFKICTSPYKIYVYQHFPKKGTECLYVTGKNDDKVKVHPNSFPWTTINLAPEGGFMLENRHHSIFDAGFAYTFSLLDYLIKKYEPESNDMIAFNGIVKVKDMECYHLTFTNTKFKLVNYTTGQNETPITIAKKFHLNYYMVLENNPILKGTGTIKKGTTLILPNDYATKMELYIHKEKLYPVNLRVYDNKGLFEEFTFLQVVVNQTLKDIDFSENKFKSM
jgi:outer membrane lipoprotein-sorting protein